MHKLKLGQMRDITINYCLVGGLFVITCTLAYGLYSNSGPQQCLILHSCFYQPLALVSQL